MLTMAFGYCTMISMLGYIIGSVQKSKQLEKITIIPHSNDDFVKKNPSHNGKELWKLNWIPPKHLRLDKYQYGDENV